MKSIVKDIIIYALTILVNIGLAFLFNSIFFESNKTYLIMFSLGVILLNIIIVYIISQKLGYKLDLFAYNIEDLKFSILNNIFLGDLFSVPIVIFIAALF